MKRICLVFLLMCILLCFSGCFAEEVSFLYSDTASVNGFNIEINETANCCFVSSYDCEEYTEGLELTIPDEYDGIPVKRIGGYIGRGAPSPFRISLSSHINISEDSDNNAVFTGDISNYDIPEEHNVENLLFILNIGKNIEKIDYVAMDEYYPHVNEDGSITFYHPTVSINCSDENQHFYSKDGKLYDKNSDELITEFIYE